MDMKQTMRVKRFHRVSRSPVKVNAPAIFVFLGTRFSSPVVTFSKMIEILGPRQLRPEHTFPEEFLRRSCIMALHFRAN